MNRLLLPPRGFLSYVRDDDELTDHRISQLCEAIRKSLKFHLGQNVVIFQDTTEIGHGARWKKRTEKAIADAGFFIPILTPAYLNSSWCGWELRQFRERESALISAHPVLAGASLIFPINLTNVDETDSDEQGLFDELQQLQHLAFGDLLYGDFDKPPARTAITRFVADIRILLRTPLDTVAPSPPPSPPPPAPEAVQIGREGADVAVSAPMPDSKPPRTARPRRPKPEPGPAQPPAPPPPPPPPPPDEPGMRGGLDKRQRKLVLIFLGLIVLVVVVVVVARNTSRPSVPSSASNSAANGAAENDMGANEPVDNGVEPVATSSGAAVSRGVIFTNSCPQPLRLHLHYYQGGAWRDPSGPWLIEGNSTIYLYDRGVPLQPSSSLFYLYAVTTGESDRYWGGDHTRRFGRETLPSWDYRARNSASGDYLITLPCHPTNSNNVESNTAGM